MNNQFNILDYLSVIFKNILIFPLILLIGIFSFLFSLIYKNPDNWPKWWIELHNFSSEFVWGEYNELMSYTIIVIFIAGYILLFKKIF